MQNDYMCKETGKTKQLSRGESKQANKEKKPAHIVPIMTDWNVRLFGQIF